MSSPTVPESGSIRTGHRWWLWLGLLVTGTVAAAVWNIQHEFGRQREQAAERLSGLAELRDTQIEAWMQRQMAMASFLSGSSVFAEQFLRWQQQGDRESGERLMARLIEFRKANDADGALVVGADGLPLAREFPAAASEPEPRLTAAVLRALASGSPQHTGVIYRAEGRIPLRVDVVTPLLHTGSPPIGALVLRMDVERTLLPLLQAGNRLASPGTRLALWRREGELLLPQDPVALRAGATAAVPWASSPLLPARVLRGEAAADRPLQVEGSEGASMLAVARAIEGTDWWLVAQAPMQEVDAPARATAAGTGAVALMLLGMGLLAMRVWGQHRSLELARRERHEHRERLRALGLLQAVTRSSDDAIFAKDTEGRYMLYNRAACEEVGLSEEQVLGRTDAELFGAEVAAMLAANDRRALQDDALEVFDETLPTPRGLREKLCTKGPLRDAEGRLLGVFGVSRDVTETRRAERALRDSEAHHRSIIAVLAEGVVVMDAQGRVLSCNPAAERIVGSPQQAWQGGDVIAPGWQVLGPDDLPLAPEQTPPGRVLATGQAVTAELIRTRTPDGRLGWFELSALPVISPDDGRLLSVVCSFWDVTERKSQEDELARHRDELEQRVRERTAELQQANDALADAARFVNTITDALPGRVAYWDAEQRCRYANRAWFDWFGMRPDEVLGRRMSELIDADYYAAQRPRIVAALTGEAQVFERVSGSGEAARVHEVHYLPDRPATGPVRGLYAIAFDITARKRAEEALAEARDRAEAANRAKSAFLANMSHEIRTPMNAVIGLAHLMSRDTRDPVQRDRLRKLDRAAQHLLQVINDILDLSKIEAGKFTLEDTEFSLDAMVSRCFEMVSERAHEKGLELVLDTDHLPERLRGDPTRLSQALINLLSNAVKFTERGWVRLQGELLSEDEQGLHVRFEVRDTGPGIALEHQGALFQAFEQADGSSTRLHGGTGLGLALTRHLARLMGGDADLRSIPGQGSTFWFTATLQHAGADAPAALPLVSMRGLRALLVDDLPEARTALVDRLRLLGLQADALADGPAALQRLQDEASAGRAYDVLLVDWRMAPLDGLQVLQQAHALLGAAMPPSILATAFDDPQLWSQARAVGCQAVLVKPVTASALHDTLLAVLRHQQAPLAEPVPPGAAEARLRDTHAGRRVLLAEDNPINQEVAGALLGAVGLVVETADNGAAAVEMALNRPYDVVLMDVQMPGMDGLAATRALRERAGSALPVIAMTAHVFGEDLQACLAAGMNDHVAKPVDPESLYATLLRWLPALPAHRAADRVPQASPPAVGGLADVPGFDMGVALRNMGGQAPVMQRVLDRFVATYAGGEAALDGSGTVEDLQRWRHAAHSLRGACATVGATALEQALRDFETALDTEGTDPALLARQAGALHETLRRLVSDLAQALQPVAPLH